HVPLAASAVLYEGTLCFKDASGNFTGAPSGQLTFGGLVCEMVDNTGGAARAKYADVWTEIDALLTCSAATLTNADIGLPVYAVDTFRFTKTAAGTLPVGVITEVVDATHAFVALQGVGERDTGPLS